MGKAGEGRTGAWLGLGSTGFAVPLYCPADTGAGAKWACSCLWGDAGRVVF